MRIIIEAHFVDDREQTERVQLCAFERELTTDPIGMSLAEGKALLAAAQRYFVRGQCAGISCGHARCEVCEAKLSLKGWHHRQI